MIALGLVLAVASTVAINGGYALEHAGASSLPPLSLLHPVRGLRSLFAHRLWLIGFLVGIGGWVLYVVALRWAPLSLVQAAAAAGIGVLALGGRLSRRQRVGVGTAFAGLLLLGVSLGSHTHTTRGLAGDVALWMVLTVVVAGAVVRGVRGAAGFGTAAGLLYSAGDIGTKAAVVGGQRLWFVPALLACHWLGFVTLQLGFQRGGRLATAGVAGLWTNAVPIAAGMALFGEGLPHGLRGTARVAAFLLVLAAAFTLGGGATAVPAASGPEPSRA